MKPDIEHPELEAQLFECPDDLMLWQVYADWLSEQGDPRGRLLAVKLAGGKAARRVFRDEKPVRESLLAKLVLAEGMRGVVELGFLKRLELLAGWGPLESGRYMALVERQFNSLKRLFESNHLRFCESISIDTVRGLDYAALFRCWTRPLPGLKKLMVGSAYTYEMKPGDIGRFCGLAPRLESLSLGLNGVEQSAWSRGTRWEHLTSLQVELVRCSPDFFEGLAHAYLPVLQNFSLHLLDPQDWGAVKGNFQKADFGRLTQLKLRGVDFGPNLIEDLMRAPFLSNLKFLDLAHNAIGVEGGAFLLAHQDQFRHVRLCVNDNDLSADQEEQLSTWPNVVWSEWDQ